MGVHTKDSHCCASEIVYHAGVYLVKLRFDSIRSENTFNTEPRNKDENLNEQR